MGINLSVELETKKKIDMLEEPDIYDMIKAPGKIRTENPSHTKAQTTSY